MEFEKVQKLVELAQDKGENYCYVDYLLTESGYLEEFGKVEEIIEFPEENLGIFRVSWKNHYNMNYILHDLFYQNDRTMPYEFECEVNNLENVLESVRAMSTTYSFSTPVTLGVFIIDNNRFYYDGNDVKRTVTVMIYNKDLSHININIR